MAKYFFSLFLLPMLLTASTQWTAKGNPDFSVEATLSSSKISLDDTLTTTLLFRYPGNYTLDLDRLRMNLLKYAGLSEPPFALTSESVEETPGGKKVVYVLEPLRDGIHFLSFYDIVFNPVTDHLRPVLIISSIFEVEITLPAVEKDFVGLTYPLLPLNVRFPISITQENRKNLLANPSLESREASQNVVLLRQKTLPIPQILGIFLFLFLVLIARMQPAKKPDLEKQMQKQAVTIKKTALKSLHTLHKKNLPHKEAYEEYYINLTKTVREYIENTCHVKATRETSIEFLQSMAKYPAFDTQTKVLLEKFLSSSDRVKFAAHKPSNAECEEAYQIAEELIHHL